MKIYLSISIALLLILLFAGPFRGASDAGLNIPFPTHAGVTATIGLGLEERLGPFTTEQSGATATYSNGVYQIQITETPSRARSLLRVKIRKVSGDPFRLNNFGVSVRVSRNAIQGIWYPGAEPSSTNAMAVDAGRVINDMSDANYGIPYIAAASSNSRNVFAMGLGRQDASVAISGQPVDRTFYEFRLKALTARTAASFDEQFYISTDSSVSWFDAAENYAQWVDELTNYRPFPVSARAYEPLYDTWYWSGDRVDDRLYLDTAKLASEVGIGLYLADSGWDTLTGEYEKWLQGRTGDYIPPPSKFRSLPSTFETIRTENKMGIDLWLQPFAVGRRSVRYPVTRNNHIHIPTAQDTIWGWSGLSYAPFALPLGGNLETVNLCPRVSSTHTYLRALFNEMATRYKPDGYWLDFIDGIATYCVAPHNHDFASFGEGFKKSLETIKNTILSRNPSATVHFRARYANLNTKPYANVWQSGDSPEDFDAMRLNTIRLRPFSKGVVVAADQMYWRGDIGDVLTSKFIMTSIMIGVPAFGPNLIEAPPETLEMLKAWLTFYRKYQTDLSTGRFSPFGGLKMPNHKIESDSRTFAYIRNLDFSEVPAERHTIFLLNATDGDRFTGRVRGAAGIQSYDVTVLDRFLGAEPGRMSVQPDASGVLHLSIAVEQGGIIVIEANETTKKGLQLEEIVLYPKETREPRGQTPLAPQKGNRRPAL